MTLLRRGFFPENQTVLDRLNYIILLMKDSKRAQGNFSSNSPLARMRAISP